MFKYKINVQFKHIEGDYYTKCRLILKTKFGLNFEMYNFEFGIKLN